jgi:hypothetical protein
VEVDYHEQKASQRPNLIYSEDISSGGEHSDNITCLPNNDQEHSPYSYEYLALYQSLVVIRGILFVIDKFYCIA